MIKHWFTEKSNLKMKKVNQFDSSYLLFGGGGCGLTVKSLKISVREPA